MKADLHTHSSHSGDSPQSVEQLLEACRARGIGVVAITDHNSLRGSEEALRLKLPGLIIVPAMEITSADGHILAYNISEAVPRDRSAAETIDLVHDRGGIAVAAHPFRFWSGLGADVIRANRFDALETMNGRNTDRSNRRGQLLAVELDLPTTGGSDAHRPELVGSAFCDFPSDCTDADAIVASLLRKNVRLGGHGRLFRETFRYGIKAIGQWGARGFRRL
ncbi:MAG TPA: CehA/McbA family metallohydrolase [Methanomassiliicoccales archaeon]|nr:CehA/McbA family metallohydrolase [Methanomassiliicoccales archaeon]